MPTITKKQKQVDLEDKLSSPFILILWNDDYNSFDWVIECLMRVCGHEFEQASQCAHLVHYTGKCDVKRGDKETISAMYKKLKGANLTVTMEEA
jgi:ATP-dependent Clp protease adaptor protein ClpS